MLILFIIMAAWVLIGIIEPVISQMVEVNKINDYIKKNDIREISQSTYNTMAKDSNIGKYFILEKDKLNYTLINDIQFISVDKYGNIRAMAHPFENLVWSLSYFTMLSNILIVVVFGFSLFKKEDEGKIGIIKSNIMIMATVYITITFLIFNFALFPYDVAAHKGWPYNDAIVPLKNGFLHIFNPIVFIVYQVKYAHHEMDLSKYKENKKKLIFIEIYILLSYGAFAIIRGGIKMLSGSFADDKTAFPYFFIEVFADNPLGDKFKMTGMGILLFIVFVLIIAAIAIGFGNMYMALVKKRIIKSNEKNINTKSEIKIKK